MINRDDIEKIFHHSFYNELRVTSEEHPVIVTIPVWSPASYKEALTQMMFETFNVPALLAINQATLVAIAFNYPTGLVVLLGERAGFVVPVHEARALEHQAMKLPFGGCDLTDYFIKLVQKDGYIPTTTAEREIARNMKETLCFVQESGGVSSQTSVSKPYQLPDGTCVNVTSACYECPEALFNPSLLGINADPLPDLIVKTIQKCPVSLQSYLKANVMLAGGTSLFPGLKERIAAEVLQKHQMNIYFTPSSIKKYHTWVGASILSTLSEIVAPMFITKEEYDTFGPSVVHKYYF